MTSFRLCGKLSLISRQRRFSSFTTMVYSKPRPVQTSKVLVLGAGNFGSCLASHLGDVQHEVHMWAREDRIVKYFNEHKRNPVYLPDHNFPENIIAIGPELPNKEFIDNMDVLLFAIPTQYLRSATRILQLQ